MGSHPVNLALRFLLELGALFCFGLWGWRAGSGGLKWGLAALLPVLAAVVWSTFAVPGDPSRSGAAPVPVPGWTRLVVEAAFFVIAAYCLHRMGMGRWATAFAAITLLHYAVSYDRIAWLLER